ncbi:hypothetical protein M407DRAFT_246475 [Tulasnella calospora MUT 4182]|uniref:Uncharacterized protein n=1 Tax=Tulasnella calospora MUT 4182 TaxID=1051891 RepID=A0A0C3Q513_9AGAM|nr:hypothetical protein M407DRAFT_246475 [Tulasnella calospora MUT 4182]
MASTDSTTEHRSPQVIRRATHYPPPASIRLFSKPKRQPPLELVPPEAQAKTRVS